MQSVQRARHAKAVVAQKKKNADTLGAALTPTKGTPAISLTEEAPWTAAGLASAKRTRSVAEKMVGAFVDAADAKGRIDALSKLEELTREAYGADAAAVAAVAAGWGMVVLFEAP